MAEDHWLAIMGRCCWYQAGRTRKSGAKTNTLSPDLDEQRVVSSPLRWLKTGSIDAVTVLRDSELTSNSVMPAKMTAVDSGLKVSRHDQTS